MNVNNLAAVFFPSFGSVRYRFTFLVSLFLCFLFAFAGQAQALEPSPFEKSIAIAIASNPKIRTAKTTFEATREKYHQSLAELLPQVSLNASKSKSYAETKTSVDSDFANTVSASDRISDTAQAGINVAQPLFRWQSVLALQQTAPLISSVEADLHAITQDVLLESIQVIITLLLTENMASLAENNLVFTRRNLEAAETRRKAGHLTRTDVDQATARVSSAEAELIRAKNEAMVARARFEEVVGITVPEGLSVPHAPSHLLQGDLLTLTAKIADRPNIKAARYRLELAEYAVKIEEAGHYPTIDLAANATVSRNELEELTIDTNQYGVTVQLTLPLYSGGRTVSRTRESQITQSSKQADLDLLRNQAMREVNQAYLAMHSAKATVASSEAAFKFYNASVNGMQEEFNAGFRTIIDLLEAQNQLFRSHTDLVKNHYELVTAQYQLLHTIGLLTMENLQIPEISDSDVYRDDPYSAMMAEIARRDDGAAGDEAERLPAAVAARTTWKKLPPLSQGDPTDLTITPSLIPAYTEPRDLTEAMAGKTGLSSKRRGAVREIRMRGLRMTRKLSLGAQPAKKAKPTEKSFKRHKKKTVKDDGPFYVSVGSFKKMSSVVHMAAKLAAAGHTPIQEEIVGAGETLMRVIFGPFKTRREASRAQKRLNRKGEFKDSIVTHAFIPEP